MSQTDLKVKKRDPLQVFLILAVTLPLVYYAIVLLHEWGHGTTAWLLGYKTSPFQVRYGGWLLLSCDEAVPYDRILAGGKGVQAALIGISGFTVNALLFLVSLVFLNRRSVKSSLWLLSLAFWSGVLNVMALFGYIPLDTFSTQGDIGRFVHGLKISPWLVFVPETILVGAGLYRLLRREIVKVYVFAPVRSVFMRRILLGVSLFLIFLLLYTQGYNPFSDSGTNTYSKVLAGLSILLAPILFVVCDPAKSWVKGAARRYSPDQPAPYQATGKPKE